MTEVKNESTILTTASDNKKGLSLKRWTPKEDKIVRQQIRRKDLSLPQAFIEAAKLLDRSPGSVGGHYYDFIRRKPAATKKVFKGKKTRAKRTPRIISEHMMPLENDVIIMPTGNDKKNNPSKNMHKVSEGGISLSNEILQELCSRMSREDKKLLILALLK